MYDVVYAYLCTVHGVHDDEDDVDDDDFDDVFDVDMVNDRDTIG